MLCTVYIYINIKHRYLYVYKIHPGARGTRFDSGVTGRTLAWQGEGHGQGKVWGGVAPQKTRPSKDRKGPRGFKSLHRPLTTPVLEPANNVHVLVVFVQNEST